MLRNAKRAANIGKSSHMRECDEHSKKPDRDELSAVVAAHARSSPPPGMPQYNCDGERTEKQESCGADRFASL